MWGADSWGATPWASLQPAVSTTTPSVPVVVAHLVGQASSFDLDGRAEALAITGRTSQAFTLPLLRGPT